MNVEFTLIRSSRRSISMRIDGPGKVTIRAPLRMSEREIRRFVESRKEWLQKNMQKVVDTARATADLQPLTPTELKELTRQAKEQIPQRVQFFARQMGVEYNRITIRCQKTRWGSCSSRKDLNFNCLLMMVPEEELDYVVVHELCHLREMNHSPAFWAQVEAVLPDYKERKAWFRSHGAEIMSRHP